MTLFTAIIAIHSIAALLSLFSVIYLILKTPSKMQRLLTVSAITGWLGVVGYLFELLSTTKEEAFLAARVGYLGKCFSMVLILMFVTMYCDVAFHKIFQIILVAFSVIMLLIIFTSPYHKLYYTSVDFVETNGFKHLVLGKGVFYYLFMLLLVGTMLAYLIIMIGHTIRRKGEDRIRNIMICVAGIIPGAALVANLLPILKGYDPTPLGIFATILLFTIIVYRYGLLDPYQLATEKILDNNENGIVVISRSQELIYANKRIYDVFPELGNKALAEQTIKEWFGGIGDDKRYINTVTKNDIIYEITISTLTERDSENSIIINGYMAIVLDKTKEYNRTKELTKLKDEAQKANQAKSVFLANMSHEIRTPMNGILGFADLALANDMNEETKQYVSHIKTSAKALLGIINNVLDISKIESGKMEIIEVEYSPVKLLREIVVMMQNQAKEKGLEFKTKVLKAFPKTLSGDNIKIREIMINILGNAIKYTRSGSVELIVDCENIGDNRVKLIAHVKDTGIGIKPEDIDKIFSTFEQVDNESNYHVEGTGLGLSISREMAQLMGGSLSVQSEYGKGSDFCIEIIQNVPNDEEYSDVDIETADEMEVTEINDFNVENVKTLIVDDNKINLMVEEIVMQKYGMETSIAESGADAIELAKEIPFDLILMDQMMPEMDGIETMHHIRKLSDRYKKVPVILVTANAVVGVEDAMKKEGFDGYVTKPIEAEKMKSVLANLLPADKIKLV